MIIRARLLSFSDGREPNEPELGRAPSRFSWVYITSSSLDEIKIRLFGPQSRIAVDYYYHYNIIVSVQHDVVLTKTTRYDNAMNNNNNNIVIHYNIITTTNK